MKPAADVTSTLTAMPTATTPLTGQGLIAGTLQYMAPEQLEGREADARTDIFAFGLVLYEMIAGKACVRSPQPGCRNFEHYDK